MAAWALIGLILMAGVAWAQDYELIWRGAEPGMTISEGGPYQVMGAIGGSTPGSLQGGAYEWTGDLAGYGEASPQPVSPVLTVTLTTDGLLVSWPASGEAFVLQSATGIEPGLSWTQVTEPYAVHGDRLEVIVEPGLDALFLRLGPAQP
jgi:hypothetical protein